MKKIITTAAVALIVTSSFADYTGRYDMMESRIKNKMEVYKKSACEPGIKFLEKKLKCVTDTKESKKEADLKACKKNNKPQTLKKITKEECPSLYKELYEK